MDDNYGIFSSEIKKEIIPIVPSEFSDVEKAVRNFSKRKGVIVDLNDVPDNVAIRMLDFISGAVFACKGKIKRIKYKTYILIPEGITITRESVIQRRKNETKR